MRRWYTKMPQFSLKEKIRPTSLIEMLALKIYGVTLQETKIVTKKEVQEAWGCGSVMKHTLSKLGPWIEFTHLPSSLITTCIIKMVPF